MRKKLIIAVVILAVIGSIYYFFSQRGDGAYATAKVVRQDLEEIVFSTGELSSENRVDLAFKVSGKLKSIYVEEGKEVVKGQKIASIDNTELENTLQQKENSFRSTQSNVDKILDDIRLAQNGGTGETQTQKNLREVAQAARDTAYDQVKAAKNDLSEADLVAPVAGKLTSLSKKEGELVVAYTTTVATIADPQKPIFEVELDENDIGKIRVGQEAKITIDAYAEKEIKGDVYFVSPQVTETTVGTKIITVKIRLTSPDFPIIIGLGGDAQIMTSKVTNVISIAQSAIFELDEKKYVYKIEDGKAIKQEVKTGVESQDDIEIKSGIDEGQTVITEKTDKIKEGQKVKFSAE